MGTIGRTGSPLLRKGWADPWESDDPDKGWAYLTALYGQPSVEETRKLLMLANYWTEQAVKDDPFYVGTENEFDRVWPRLDDDMKAELAVELMKAQSDGCSHEEIKARLGKRLNESRFGRYVIKEMELDSDE